MKKKILLALMLALPTVMMAQTNITETFDDRVYLDWQEFSNKKGTGLIKNGYLELQCKDKDKVQPAVILVELPVSAEHDFKLTSKIIVPKLDENYFGIVMDRDENFNKCMFLLKEGEFLGCIANDNQILAKEEIAVKLKGGKDQAVEIVLERRGGKYIFYMNNMKIIEFRRNMNSPTFGFYTQTTIKVDEFKVEQEYSGGNSEY